MILKYIGKDDSGFVFNKNYFAFEIYINPNHKDVRYYLVDYSDEIAIYSGTNFEIVNNSLDNMVYTVNVVGKYPHHVIRLKELQEIDDNTNNINKIWGAYHDDDREVVEKVHSVLIKQAKKENFIINKIETA